MRTPNQCELKVGMSQKSTGMKKMGTQRMLTMDPAVLALPVLVRCYVIAPRRLRRTPVRTG